MKSITRSFASSKQDLPSFGEYRRMQLPQPFFRGVPVEQEGLVTAIEETTGQATRNAVEQAVGQTKESAARDAEAVTT